MAISATDKLKVMKYLNEHKLGKLYYETLRSNISKKCQDKDIIIYFISTIEEKLAENKISDKIFSKMLAVIYYLITEQNTKIDANDYSRLFNLSLLYEEYLKRSSEEKDEDIIFYLKKIEELEESVSNKEPEKAKEITPEIAKLKELLAKEEVKYEELRKKYERNESVLSDKKDRIKSLQKEITDLNERISNLKKIIKEYIKEIEILASQNQSFQKELEKAQKLTQKYYILLQNFSKLQKDITSRDAKIKELELQLESCEVRLNSELEKQQEQTKKIQEIIIAKLYIKEYTFEDLLNELQNEGHEINAELLNNLLNTINENITIINSKTFPVIYKVIEPQILTNESLTINTFARECYDVLLTSDFHIYYPYTGFEKYNCIYEYCTKTGIELILNLGDFIHGFYGTKTKQIDFYNKLIAEIIEKFPKSPTISQIILGGNHDKESLPLGIDALKTISKYRRDIRNIGYDEAKIFIAKDNHPFILHHFCKRMNSYDSLNQRISDYYSRNMVNPEDTYLNIAGHLHKSLYDYNNNLCIVPSLTFDRQQNGAWHLKIYLNSDQTIKYLILIPLILHDNNLIPVNEIVHERKLIKNI